MQEIIKTKEWQVNKSITHWSLMHKRQIKNMVFKNRKLNAINDSMSWRGLMDSNILGCFIIKKGVKANYECYNFKDNY
jgi:hypothetical protein